MSYGAQYSFKPDIPGHVLEANTKVPPRHGIVIRCTCGEFGTSLRVRTDGTADARSQREWAEHLKIHEIDPTHIRPIGVVKKKIVTHEVFVFPTSYVGFDDFNVNEARWAWYLNRGPDDPYGGTRPWVVGIQKKTKRTANKILHCFCPTEVDAISAARDYIGKCDVNGFKVELAEDSLWEPEQAVQLSANMSFMVLLTSTEEALSGKDLEKIETALEESEKLLQLVPIIAQRHEELKSHREHLLTGKLLS